MPLQTAREEQQELQLQMDSLDGEAVEASRAAAESRVSDCRSVVSVCKERHDSIRQGYKGVADSCNTLEASIKVTL